jgi:transcriptional regulator with XRE-family HTH domain
MTMNRHSVQRQRIGPAVRRLRRSRGMTLDQLAEAAAVSPSHLSRLERSQTLPSFPVMAKIAEALEVDVNEFVRLEHDVTHLDDTLGWYLNLFALPDEVNQEFFGLTIEARRALVTCLDRLSMLNLTPYSVQEQVERTLVSGGDYANLSALASLVERAGMDCVGLTQALLLLNVLVGRQTTLIAGPSLLPITPGNSLVEPYRWAFPTEPLDPLVGQWWLHPHETSSGRSSPDRPSRLVVGVQALASPLGAAIASSVRSVIDQDELVEVAITERQLGTINVSISGDYALVEQLVSRRGAKGNEHVALWLSGARRVAALEATIDRTWESLTASERDPATVRDRLKRMDAAPV